MFIDCIQRIWFYFFDQCIMYPLMGYFLPRLGINFMNLGYWPIDYATDQQIQSIVEDHSTNKDKNRPHYFLYEKTLSLHPAYPKLRNLQILEVGCGHGGGIQWIQSLMGEFRTHPEIGRIQGMDKIHMAREITRGSAEQMPFGEQSFDMVLNVESSHLYTDCSKFFSETYRVLTYGGYLCFSDLRYVNDMPKMFEQAKQAGLVLMTTNDITDNVLEGITHTAHRFDKLLEKIRLQQYKMYSSDYLNLLVTVVYATTQVFNSLRYIQNKPSITKQNGDRKETLNPSELIQNGPFTQSTDCFT